VGLALLLVAVVWKIVSYKIKLAAALKAERQRALIDRDAIAASSWEGDKAYSAELGGEEVERRIREAVSSAGRPVRRSPTSTRRIASRRAQKKCRRRRHFEVLAGNVLG
jgi:hypothetical protein